MRSRGGKPSPAGGRRWRGAPDEGGGRKSRGEFKGRAQKSRGDFKGRAQKGGGPGFRGKGGPPGKRFDRSAIEQRTPRGAGFHPHPSASADTLSRPRERGPDSGPGFIRTDERPGRDDLLYGINAVLEALRARPDDIERVFLLQGALNPRLAGELLSRANEARVRVDRVERQRLDALAGNKHQGVVAEVHAFRYCEPADILQHAGQAGQAPLVVVLDGIQDPQNLGAIIRSAHAFGAHGVIFPRDRAAAITSTAAKASAGATAHTKIARVTNLSRTLEELKHAGLWIVGAEMSGEKTPEQIDLKGPIALVVGAEGAGMRQLVREHCDFLARIPMAGKMESLNASVSAAVLLYEAIRQRAVAPAS